jgi:putative SOS response-associated peptidase YedK
MCYYNSINIQKGKLIKLAKVEKELKNLNLIKGVASGFEYGNWPILKPTQSGKDFEIELAHWELIPSWINNNAELIENRNKFTTLNATAEKLLESRLYKDAANKRRCLVLSSGFYEWQHYKPAGSKKEIAYPYFISLPKHAYFFMAGIYQPWVDQSTGETIDSFSIITTKANSLMAAVHNKKQRMPTILTDELAYEWMQDELSANKIQALANFQYPANEMQAVTIKKDFRTSIDPTEAYTYTELPPVI